ncbi:MAG: proline--tRNA ligase, partial [Elusimicrobiota bacterium]
MKLSKFFLPTLKEVPSEADTISNQLMIRSGMIRKLASGIYEWLPLGLRVLKKAEQIVREEMNRIGGQEVWLPLLLPKELWEETGRWSLYGKELFRLKDRKEGEFCLGPTHEEAITDIVRKEVRSYRELPLMLYQFGTKFRDEIRPRFGVMRAKEFYMKDAYSFHALEKDAEDYYKEVFEAYSRICQRCGFKFRAVEAATGAIGGKYSHEFMVIADTGEEEIAWCDCGYASNVEKAECARVNRPSRSYDAEEPGKLQEVHTPGMRTVAEVGEFLKAPPEKFIKTLIYVAAGKPVAALIRGNCEINESKLKEVIGTQDLTLADEQIIEKVTGAPVGFAGPVNLQLAPSDFRLIADYSVETIINAISGANKKDYHLKNINIARDYQPDEIVDIRKIKEDDVCPRCNNSNSKINFSRGIEVGHTFKLGMKYSKSM